MASCHVERPLDDRVWARFARLQAARPGGFRIAALLRPPDPAAGEDEQRWLERARAAATRGPLGHHTHWTSPTHARPSGGDPGERVRREGEWLLKQGLHPTLFCGGGWYMDASVAGAVAKLGYADCTATSFRPPYLEAGAPRLALAAPGRLTLRRGGELLELPTTHSLGMAARAALRRREPAEPVVHVYFHDTDLLDPRRAAALRFALEVLGRRRTVTDLDRLAELLNGDVPVQDLVVALGQDAPVE
ncbi:MAG: hypothetical protein MSC30_16445 [Gaiellaceae bacterium MAG52_C11]|nr:hypothetical protein [Candidatus Gaiellasilicea maunaloa]